jgi:hypothetical protein
MQKICLQQQLRQSQETAFLVQQFTYCLECITITVVGAPINSLSESQVYINDTLRHCAFEPAKL